MRSFRVLSILAIAASVSFLPTQFVRADDLPAEEVTNSKYQAVGKVNANAVYIRSGPSENDYPVIKIDKDAEVTVVGEKFGWLKIVPPQGSFCYVAKAYVEKRGDGKVGRVTNTLNVRIGSELNAMKTRVASKLEPGADVSIIDEQDEYFKITPPEGVFLYVSKQFVDPVKAIAPAGTPKKQPDSDDIAKNNPPVPQPPINDGGGTVPPAILPPDTISPTPPLVATTQDSGLPTTQPGDTSIAGEPTTQPIASVGDLEAEFDKAELAFDAAARESLEKQPLDELIETYGKLSANSQLPESLRRIAESRLLTLKDRSEVKAQFVAVKKRQDDMKARQQSLAAERDEIEQRIKATGIVFYTAVGVVRPSSLQQGPGSLFRLTDPQNGRTIVYIRTNDPSYANQIGQFVGIRGEVTDDANLGGKVITPTALEAVDPALVNVKVAAQIVPPSMLPGAPK